MLLAMRWRTSGVAASDCTLGSQFCFATASASCLSLTAWFCAIHCWIWIISSGYVEAAKTFANNWSEYSAIGATNESNWSGGILGASCAVEVVVAVTDGCCGCCAGAEREAARNNAPHKNAKV